ncbi:MAG: hypothetical protein EBZ48_17380 [Proteobacteria bacterium]|nr:hypothetical protein [Pseudomonadota bacterium]
MCGGSSSLLVQIGLDGVRITEAENGRLMRVYPLDIITRWEVGKEQALSGEAGALTEALSGIRTEISSILNPPSRKRSMAVSTPERCR